VSFTASNGQTVSASTTYTTSDGTFSGGPVSESASGCATTGDFVIGNLNSAIGTPVTFWGAQWAKSNSLSGGPAPNAFKGYALNPSMPTCGETWTTSPGNSPPPPPGPLPAFIEIIVSSNITQSGNTISGDIQSIVIVATNGGYEANPGHPGTGTVVSVVC
jgi:hypothetical protein